MHKFVEKVGVLLALVLVGAISHASMAQEDERQSSGALEEVIVTARMRAESLQDVPLSETAFSSKVIEDARIDTVGDYIQLTPNVTLVDVQSAGVSFITVRGLTQSRNGEAPMAIVVDGVLQINHRQFTQSMFDIESIEVLRGPQGALYGRNAAGGAILITSKMPTDEFEGYARATVGDGDEYTIQVAAGGPIIENILNARIAIKYQDIGGYLDNVQLNEKVDYLEDLTLRAIVDLNVSENLTVTLRAGAVRTDGGAINFHYQPVVYDGDSCDTSNPFGGPITGANHVDRTFCANNLGHNERDVDELSLKWVYDFDGVTVTNIFSYTNIMESYEADQASYTNSVNLFGFFDGTQTQFVDIEAWSGELRFESNNDESLQWMFGAYYLETDRFTSITTGVDNRQGIEPVERVPFFDSVRNPTLSFIADDNDNRAWALFGNASYDVTDSLEIAVAIRYDEDKRVQNISPFNTAGLPAGCTFDALSDCQRQRTYSKLQPKVSLRYSLSDDANVYASYGEGFRSGQFNQFGVDAAAAAVGIDGVAGNIESEITKTFEVGIKSELFNNRLRLNGAIFHTKTNPVYFVFIGEVGAQVLVNIDKARLFGLEIEAVANIFEGLDAHVAFGYTDTEILANKFAPNSVGNDVPFVAKTTLNMGVQYRANIINGLDLVARLDYERRGAQFWDLENSTARKPLNLLNARIGFEDPDGVWSVTGSVINLTDVVYNAEWLQGGFVHPARPRTWHLDVKVNF